MEQLPLEDRDVILQQYQTRMRNHPHSERFKAPKQIVAPNPRLQVGDLVYLPLDHDKTQHRNRYLVVSIEKPWCFVRKFVGKHCVLYLTKSGAMIALLSQTKPLRHIPPDRLKVTAMKTPYDITKSVTSHCKHTSSINSSLSPTTSPSTNKSR